MSNLPTIKRRVIRISWAMAFILAIEAVATAWLLLGGWPLKGWLCGFAAQFPFVTGMVTLSLFGVLVYVNRPHPLPWWAMPDEATVIYGVGLTAFVTVGVIVVAVIRLVQGR